MDKVKAIKRINERMAVYQRQGLTDSANYKRIVNKIKLLDLPFNEKDGKVSISAKKKDIAEIDVKDLEILDALPSLKQERQKAKEQGYKTTKEQNEHIKNYGRLDEWIENNLSYIYNDARGGNKKAQDIEKAFSKGLRRLDYNTIWSMIDEYEKEKAKEEEIFKNSSFYNNDIHGE